MAIRFEYPIGAIGGLAAYAAGRQRGEERRRRELTALTYQRQRDREQRQFAIGLQNRREQNDLFSENRRTIEQRRRDSLAAHNREEDIKRIANRDMELREERLFREDYEGLRSQIDKFQGFADNFNDSQKLIWDEYNKRKREILQNKENERLRPADQYQALGIAAQDFLNTFNELGGVGNLKTPTEELNGANGPIQQHEASGTWMQYDKAKRNWVPLPHQPATGPTPAVQAKRQADATKYALDKKKAAQDPTKVSKPLTAADLTPEEIFSAEKEIDARDAALERLRIPHGPTLGSSTVGQAPPAAATAESDQANAAAWDMKRKLQDAAGGTPQPGQLYPLPATPPAAATTAQPLPTQQQTAPAAQPPPVPATQPTAARSHGASGSWDEPQRPVLQQAIAAARAGNPAAQRALDERNIPWRQK